MNKNSRTCYRISGLTVSSDIGLHGDPVPPCLPDVYVTQIDETTEMSPSGWHILSTVYEGRDERGRLLVSLHCCPAGFLFKWHLTCQFFISRDGKMVFALPRDPYNVEPTQWILSGSVFSFILHLKGKNNLHASAIAHNGDLIAFIAKKGGGKSTLAASMLMKGATLFADDFLVIESREGFFWGVSQSSLGKLHQDAFQYLNHLGAPLVIVHGSAFNKLIIQHESSSIPRPDRLPLKAIYLLESLQNSGSGVSISPLSRRDAAFYLIANNFGMHLLEPEARLKQFMLYSELVKKVEVKCLTMKKGIETLDQVCEAVLADRKTKLL